MIFAGFGEEIQLWNPQTGERRLLPGARPTSNLALSPDGATVLFGTADGAVARWDLATGQRPERSRKDDIPR